MPLEIPAGSVVFTSPDDLALLRYMANAAIDYRRRHGWSSSPMLDRLAAIGQTDSTPQPAEQSGPMDMTTAEAAQLLGCSERSVRRKAKQLGGHRVGRSWLLDAEAVHEHREGMAAR